MVSHVVDVLLQGVLASLTGGWFYNLHNDIFINTLHMYLWIVLGLLPLIVYLMAGEDELLVVVLYTLLVTLLFALTKGVNLYLHKVFKESDEIRSKQAEEEEEMEEVATNAAKAPSSDSITVPQGSSNAIRGSLPDSLASNNNFERNSHSNSEHQYEEAGEMDSWMYYLGPFLFKSFCYLLRHQLRPLRLTKVFLVITQQKRKFSRILATSEDFQTNLVSHISVDRDVTKYRNSVTWSTHTEYDHSENSEYRIESLNHPSTIYNKEAIYTAVFESEETALSFYHHLRTLASESPDTSKSSPKSVDKSGKSVEHTYATLDDPSKICGGGGSDTPSSTDTPSVDQSSNKKEDPAYDVLCFNDQEEPSAGGEGGGSRIQPRTPSSDTISISTIPEDTPPPEQPPPPQQRVPPSKRKVCRTDIPVDEAPGTVGAAAVEPQVSPRLLRAMKTIGAIPETGPTEAASANQLRETRSFETGSTEVPVHYRLIRQNQLARASEIRHRHRAGSTLTPSSSLKTPDSEQSRTTPGTIHLATDHTDTTPGALHKYYDENGKEHQYMFELTADDTSPATSTAATLDHDVSPSYPPQITSEYWANNLSAITWWAQNEREDFKRLFDGELTIPTDEQIPSYANLRAQEGLSKMTNVKTTSTQSLKKKHYSVKFLWKSFIIHFDRLHLERLLDEDKYLWLAFLKLLLALLCSVALVNLFYSELFHGIQLVWLCVVLAGCQFSLIKSVQPDSASPVQGFNHITPLSRPIYFLITAGILLGLQKAKEARSAGKWSCVDLYGWYICSERFLALMLETVKGILLAFPVVFLLGLFPQINTFLLFLLEQVDIHLLGGNAAHSLSGACVAVTRSILAVGVVVAFSYPVLLLEEQTHTMMWLPVMLALSLMLSYHLSRTSGNLTTLVRLIKRTCFKMDLHYDEHDNLPLQQENIVFTRFKCDVVTCLIIGIISFGVSASTAFDAAKPILVQVMQGLTIIVGVILHYLIPHLRKSMPFLWFLSPCLKTKEHALFEVLSEAKATWYEKLYLWVEFVERNIFYPLLFLAAIYESIPDIREKFGAPAGAVILSVVSIKLFRQCYSYTSVQYKILLATVLFFRYDYNGQSETFPIDYFIMSIVVCKIDDLILKMEFLLTYIAPWQIVWGSAVHAFAQPFSVPHSGLLFLQTLLSAVLCAPLSPFQGSALFVMGYVRPLKFWERDYNTRRSDSSNTRLAATLEHTFDTDQNNFNSIFYEHLCRSLQKYLCGDLMMGRWGKVSSGDCFIMASDYLNALVHIVEYGNGVVTFQLRGLEFKGTFCQMREVEAITEDDGDDKSCLCCEPGHAPGMLSVNAAFNRRWLAWEVMNTKYVLEGYSITKNSATTMLQMHDLRKMLITYYVQAIMFFAIRSEKLSEWVAMFLQTPQGAALGSDYAIERESFSFSTNIDADFDIAKAGLSRRRFKDNYLKWIRCCINKREEMFPSKSPSLLNHDVLTLCFGLSILGRRALTGTSPNKLTNPNGMLSGIHALLKNDIRIGNPKDEWVFQDMEILKEVISPAIKLALKLYQNHFIDSDMQEDLNVLYDSCVQSLNDTVVAYEGDPLWRNSILNNQTSLLTLRHVLDDTIDEYQMFTLNKRFLSFRIIKINRECVRGLWAGQQQELIFLRNTNPERGSIQHAKQALRNMINSSCDDPIGYPIYVSPLITGYSDTHRQVTQISGIVKHYIPCLGHVRRFIHRILNCSGLDNSNSIDADSTRQPGNMSVFYHHNRVVLPCDNKPSTTRPPSGSFHSCLDFGSNDPVSMESDASPVHHRSSGQSDGSKKSENLQGCVAASDPILSCVQGINGRFGTVQYTNRSSRRSFLSGRAESTSAADKSQEILPPPNLRQATLCDTENLNKVALSSRCFLPFESARSKMSSSVSLPSNSSLQQCDSAPKITTSDNHLHLTDRKISREFLQKATSDNNFNPIMEVSKSTASTDEESEIESTPLLLAANPPLPKHLSAPHLGSSSHRRVGFASTDIEIPDLTDSSDSLSSKENIGGSLSVDVLSTGADSLRDSAYSVDVGVQADRVDSPYLTRTGSAPSIRNQPKQHRPSHIGSSDGAL